MSLKYLVIPMSIVLATTTPAIAGPFDIFEDIRGTVGDVLNTIGYTRDQLEGLGKSLGIDIGDVDTSEVETGSDLAVAIYREWTATLSPSDQEIVQKFLLEYAGGQLPSIEQMIVSQWYQSLDKTQQPRVIGLSAKFNQVLELVDDKNVFLAGVFLPEGQ